MEKEKLPYVSPASEATEIIVENVFASSGTGNENQNPSGTGNGWGGWN